MIDIIYRTPQSMMDLIRKRFRSKRLALSYTQEGLAQRSGVSFGSLKLFEKTGQISLSSLLKLAFVLECLEDFQEIAKEKQAMPQSIDALLIPKTPSRKRGSIK
jgi:transcriptional regulator with XRE-family HTH domain